MALPELRGAVEPVTAGGRTVSYAHRAGIPLLMLALYGWLALRYPLLPGLAIGRATWGTLTDRSLGAGLLHGAVYTLLVGLYLLAIRGALRASATPDATDPSPFALHSSDDHDLRAQRRHETSAEAVHDRLSAIGYRLSAIFTLGLIVSCWLLASLILLAAYPGESLDIFDYLFRGRMLAEYGASPLAVSPSPFAARPFFSLITWRGQVDTYGPLWEYASGGVAWAVGRLLPRPIAQTPATLAIYITGYRLLAIGATGLCGAIIFSIVRRQSPAQAPAALLAWLWNPLLLTAGAVGAHNDLILVLWVLAALWLLQRGRWALGLLALLLAAHVKLTALLLAPVVGLWLVRRIGWRGAILRGLLAGAAMLPLSWLLYAPLGGWATLPRMLSERTRFLAYAPADLLYRWLHEQAGWAEPDARRLATLGATLLFCAVAAVLIARMLDKARRATHNFPHIRDADLWRCGLAVTVAYLLVGSFWLMPWYGLWALPLAALLPAGAGMRRWMAALTLGLLWGGLAADVLTFTHAPRLSPTQVSWVSVGLLLLPLAWVALGRLAGRFWPLTAGPAPTRGAGEAE